MWHVSALYRPCIGHRTGYSLRQMPGFSGLASADFEGVFAHKLQAVPPPAFFYARDGAFSEGMKKLTPGDRLRCELISALRAAVDDELGKVTAAGSADLGKRRDP